MSISVPITVRMLRQINLVHTPPPYFLKINLNSTATPSSYQWSLAFRLPNQNSLRISFLPHTFPAHLIFLNLIILIFGEDYRLLISSVCSFLQPPVTSSLRSKHSPHTPSRCVLPLLWQPSIILNGLNKGSTSTFLLVAYWHLCANDPLDYILFRNATVSEILQAVTAKRKETSLWSASENNVQVRPLEPSGT
jgi:hypothetical protein